MEFLNKKHVLSFFYSDVEVTEKRNRLDAILAKQTFLSKEIYFESFQTFAFLISF